MQEYLIEVLFYSLIVLVVVFMAYYPRKIEQKRIKKMQDEIKEGDKIITYSGLSGIVEKVENEYIIIKLNPDELRVKIEKWAIAEKEI